MRLTKKSPAIYLAEGDISSISQTEIEFLKSVVDETPLGRVRINLHPSSDDTLHEMFIVIKKGSYIRPHKHPGKSEAFHMVHGSARVVIYNDNGTIYEVVELAAGSPIKPFYYRMSKPYFHTLLLESDLMIMHEITNGPFVPGGTLFADFAPEEGDEAGINDFHARLHEQLKERVVA